MAPRGCTVLAPARAVSIAIGICDDHPALRAGVSAILQTQVDMSVVACAGAVPELLESMAATPVDLVLLDIELPGRSGLDALPEIAAQCRVLIYSAFDSAPRIRRAMRSGACGYVQKGCAPAELVSAVREAARGKTVLDVALAMRLAESLRAGPDEIELRRRLNSLTPRQRDVTALLLEGKSNREIGQALFISEGTARNHVARVLDLLGVPDRTKLAVSLLRLGIEL